MLSLFNRTMFCQHLIQQYNFWGMLSANIRHRISTEQLFLFLAKSLYMFLKHTITKKKLDNRN